MEFQDVIVEKDKEVTWIKLNRPQSLNALSRRLVAELITALDDAEKDPGTKVVILRGTGKSFCAGADLKEWPKPDGGAADDIGFSGLWERIEQLGKPVIAAVHGYAITGGFLLAYCCDIVIAAESAKFADTHAKWGLMPTGGETQRLPRRIGLARAKELMFTSELMDATRAERIGLVNRVVQDSDLDKTALEIARRIALNSSASIKAIKSLINKGMEGDFATGWRMEILNNRWGAANVEPNEDRDERLKRFRNDKL